MKKCLIVDTNVCAYCPAGRLFGMEGACECTASKQFLKSINRDCQSEPDWCPKKSIPDKINCVPKVLPVKNPTVEYEAGFIHGYNAVIDAILKEIFEDNRPHEGDNIGYRD